ncbi:hypothetical protein [Cohnella sp. JJ-181]|uniref:hypothetical protein n=1 Tax=Cohnella rhizoplanae TaxID=2974897 RepID=UPI0022FF8327|nr:hypothetical protein [Cohnella sp. JJ-181]CAI6027745.1 hypothetical protein COHCIP112018_00575 [Cohnella sp. JJ-181]
MQIRIGVVGTEAAVAQVLKVMHSFPSLEPVVRIVEHEQEAPDAASDLGGQVEALLLSGPAPQRLLKEKGPVAVPVHHVPLTGAGLYKALFEAQRAGRLGPDAVLSVDSLTQSMATRALRDLGLEGLATAVYDGPPYAAPDKLVAYHRRIAAGRNGVFVFTGVERVAEELGRLNIPNARLQPSDEDIIVTLERALLSTESRKGKESQIVVGMVAVDEFGKLVQRSASEHEIQKLKLDIHRMVLDYVESLDGYLAPVGGEEYLFFTTRGIFERETGGYKTIPLAKDASLSYGITLSIGIGFGATASEAGSNARSALRKSVEAGGNACFIVREDRTLIGPLEMSDPVSSILAPLDPELLRRAEEAGMTGAYLSKLLTYMSRHGKYDYQVHELASMLNITVRSAHRLLLQWADAGLVGIAGLEKMPKGRPRQVYRFSFLADHYL